MAAHIPNGAALALIYGTRDSYRGEFLPVVAAIRKPAVLVSLTRERDHLALTIDDAGVVEQFRVTTLDAPGIDRLSALDRGTVQAAIATMDRERADA